MTCAIGIAALRSIDGKEQRYFELAGRYLDFMTLDAMNLQEGFGLDWISSTLNLIVDPDRLSSVKDQLDASGVPWRHWWGLGSHTHQAFSSLERLPLTNTLQIAPRVIGIPFHLALSLDEIKEVARVLN